MGGSGLFLGSKCVVCCGNGPVRGDKLVVCRGIWLVGVVSRWFGVVMGWFGMVSG